MIDRSFVAMAWLANTLDARHKFERDMLVNERDHLVAQLRKTIKRGRQ